MQSAPTRTIGDYSLRQTETGLEIRNRPSQHHWLNRLLSALHPSLARIGLPRIVVTDDRIVERGYFGGERSWPRASLAEVAVVRARTTGPETKVQGRARPWAVRWLSADGSALRSRFRFRTEQEARVFADACVGEPG